MLPPMLKLPKLAPEPVPRFRPVETPQSHVDAQIAWIDVGGVVSALVEPAQHCDVSGVHEVAGEGMVLPDGAGLYSLQRVSREGGHQDIGRVKVCGELITVQHVSSIQVVC